MKKYVNFIKLFVRCLKQAEPVSRIILRTGCICSALVCAGAVAAVSRRVGWDAATAEYWAKQLFTLSVHLLGATAIPTFLFETMLYAVGAKSEIGEKNDGS